MRGQIMNSGPCVSRFVSCLDFSISSEGRGSLPVLHRDVFSARERNAPPRNLPGESASGSRSPIRTATFSRKNYETFRNFRPALVGVLAVATGSGHCTLYQAKGNRRLNDVVGRQDEDHIKPSRRLPLGASPSDHHLQRFKSWEHQMASHWSDPQSAAERQAHRNRPCRGRYRPWAILWELKGQGSEESVVFFLAFDHPIADGM